MRGKARRPRRVPRPLGITPAYAGKSTSRSAPPQAHRDHPRVCGEKGKKSRKTAGGIGSPPRMRGKVLAHRFDDHSCRITPAYAGKSGSLRFSSGQCRDHPRVCGEKALSKTVWSTLWGSPPRMRGKGTVYSLVGIQGGITPAYAGKRYYGIWDNVAKWDHPRVCGEKVCPHPPNAPPMGSPPRMRGKGTVYSLVGIQGGITPAYAGKRYYGIWDNVAKWDHPRVCGEKVCPHPPNAPPMGSPPRMRGKD